MRVRDPVRRRLDLTEEVMAWCRERIALQDAVHHGVRPAAGCVDGEGAEVHAA